MRQRLKPFCETHDRSVSALLQQPVYFCSLSSRSRLLSFSASMARVFVYGTLKKGQPNYHRMFDLSNGRSEFLGTAKTVETFPLVIGGPFNVPYLLNAPGRGHRVHGEIYRVDEPMLEFLDQFEGVPDHYQRIEMQLEVKEWPVQADGETLAPGSLTQAFCYNTKTYEPEFLRLPTYESYDSYGDHGLKYMEREARDE